MKIYASQQNDIGEGLVWIKKADLPPRCVVKITNSESGRIVFCEALQIEKNFLKQYNQSPRFSIDNPETSIVISAVRSTACIARRSILASMTRPAPNSQHKRSKR